MSTDPSLMLKQLGATARIAPASTPGAAAPQQGVQAGEFADLLKRAREGTLASARPVTPESAAAAELQLTDDQLARLALAADRAEAAGLRRALVTIDDRRLILDVQQRTFAPAVGAQPGGGVVDGIDGVIDLAGVLTPQAQAAPAIAPPSSLQNESVARLLATMNQRAA